MTRVEMTIKMALAQHHPVIQVLTSDWRMMIVKQNNTSKMI